MICEAFQSHAQCGLVLDRWTTTLPEGGSAIQRRGKTRHVASRSTDDLYLPVETICNIGHRRFLLMNQDETLFSAVTA